MLRVICFLVIIIFSCSNTLNAQSKRKRSKQIPITAIGINFNARLNSGEYLIFSEDFNNGITQIVTYNLKSQFSFGFSLEKLKGDKYQHFEIPNILFKKDEDLELNEIAGQMITEPTRGSRKNALHFSFRYSAGKYLIGKEDLKVGLALGIQWYTDWIKTTPKTSASFPVSIYNTGIAFQVIPKAIYQFKKDLFLEFILAPNLLDLNYKRKKTDNPLLTEKQRINANFSLRDFGKNLNFSVGIKYFIDKKNKE